MTDSAAVPVANVGPDVQHAVAEALGALIEKVSSHENILQKSQQQTQDPKAWFTDPFQLLDS